MIRHITEKFLSMIQMPNRNAKSLNYLFVLPRIVHDDTQYLFPVGFAMVSAALKASERNVFTLNFNFKEDYLTKLSQTILENDIDVILTGGLSGQYWALKEILDTAKMSKPNIITVVGGGVITADPVVAMCAFETADFGIIGEGEIAVNELAFALEGGCNVNDVAGIIMQDGRQTKPRDEIRDLDCLPFPDYEGFEFREFLLLNRTLSPGVVPSAFVICSRSCLFNCTFCFHPAGQTYRKRSLDNIFEEVDWLIHEYECEIINFNDELFIDDKARIMEFCERVKPYDIKWWAQTRVNSVSEDILTAMKDSGCYYLSFGVESGNNDILKSMNKHITTDQIERAFDAAAKVGLRSLGGIIFGDLNETSETIKSSLRWWAEHYNYNIALQWILCFPGSHLYKVACEKGIIPDPVQYLKGGCPQINISKMSDDEYWQMVSYVELFRMNFESTGNTNPDSIDVELFKSNLANVTNNHYVAIWPATTSSILTLNMLSPELLRAPNVWLVNRDLHSPSVLRIPDIGKRVYMPDIINSQNIDTVIVPARHIDVYLEIRKLIAEMYPSVTKIIRTSELLIAM